MYMEAYNRWLNANLEDPALSAELQKIAGQEDEIKDRFAVSLKFGTAGLRGVLGAGSNRMNIYVVRQATQGLANWVKTQGGKQLVAISYDSRINSDVFAKTAACVLAANGIKVRIYDALMPVPALSFARLAPHNTATIHNSYDTLKLMKAEQVQEDTDFIAAFTERMANAVLCPVSREIPDSIKEKLDYYLLRKRKPE